MIAILAYLILDGEEIGDSEFELSHVPRIGETIVLDGQLNAKQIEHLKTKRLSPRFTVTDVVYYPGLEGTKDNFVNLNLEINMVD